jgi:hypothetical protein
VNKGREDIVRLEGSNYDLIDIARALWGNLSSLGIDRVLLCRLSNRCLLLDGAKTQGTYSSACDDVKIPFSSIYLS